MAKLKCSGEDSAPCVFISIQSQIKDSKNRRGVINNGQFRETGNIGHRTQNEDKQNTTAKNISNTDPTKTCSRIVTVPVSYETPAVFLMVKGEKSLVSERGQKKKYT